MPRRVKFELYYDIGSPRSYIAFETLLRYASVWNIDLDLHPLPLGAIHKLSNNSSPGVHPLKGAHGAVDFSRWLDEYGLPGSIPSNFPGPDHNTLPVSRFLRVIKDECSPSTLSAVTHFLFEQLWARHVKLLAPEFLGGLCPSIFTEKQLKDFIDKSVTPENKEKVKNEAAAVVEEYGCFGFPWIVVHMTDGRKESWFGSDRMSSIAHCLGPEYRFTGPFPPTPEMPPSHL